MEKFVGKTSTMHERERERGKDKNSKVRNPPYLTIEKDTNKFSKVNQLTKQRRENERERDKHNFTQHFIYKTPLPYMDRNIYHTEGETERE